MALDADLALQTAMGSFIHAAGWKSSLGGAEPRWTPGKRLKLLFAGYVGTRNTGADVRVEEMIRQVRHVIGDQNLDLTIMTIDPLLTQGYFENVHQIRLPEIFPKFLYDECPKHHGVIACEGSMFKSKFANALTIMMAGALGIAARENKLSIGFGAEAGEMTPTLRRFVGKHCQKSFVLCRNEPSRKVLGDLGIRTVGGADTAWTFEPSLPGRGADLLRQLGWDGTTPILFLCPINPFWWPVKPSLFKAATKSFIPEYRSTHYKSLYFHEYSSARREKYCRYLSNIAQAVAQFEKEVRVFPVLVAMEKLDRKACEGLSKKLRAPAPIISSDEHDMFDLVSMLRHGSYMVSSRFHAVVTSMPGLVPSAGVTMDERIRNLMNDRGHSHLFLEVEDPDLSERLLEILRTLHRDREQISTEIGQAIPKQLKLMGQMGVDFMDEVQRVYPDFPRRIASRSWEQYLPPLPQTVADLLEKYA